VLVVALDGRVAPGRPRQLLGDTGKAVVVALGDEQVGTRLHRLDGVALAARVREDEHRQRRLTAEGHELDQSVAGGAGGDDGDERAVGAVEHVEPGVAEHRPQPTDRARDPRP
jgi:hypothetical protein